MQTIIYLVRHSEIKNNKEVKNEELELSEEGIRKVKQLEETKLFENASIIISSPYKSATETAKYLSKKEINIDTRLEERKQGTEYKEKSFWLEQLNNIYAKAKEGESHIEVRERMLNMINELLNNYCGKEIILVTHATAMTFLLMNWCKLTDVDLTTKRRKLEYKNKVVIDDCFKKPEIFKLIFNDNKLELIKRIIYEK